MRILFIADGRSPIALNWMRFFVERGHEVHLASSFACQPQLSFTSLHFFKVAFSGWKAADSSRLITGYSPVTQSRRRGGAALIHLRTRLRQLLGPLTLSGAARQVQSLVATIRPDLVHAMRIPYEGMAAAQAGLSCPLLVSVWGNDFTLHAPVSFLMRRSTRLTLQRASALHTDCQRDLKLAHAWGFPIDRKSIVLPGGGGVQLDLFHPPEQNMPTALSPAVINPRGFRAYVRNDTFFQAIPLILKEKPTTRFICPAMQGEPLANQWIHRLGIAQNVFLLPPQTRQQMAELFRSAQVAVSITNHDGTPNTLLEAMACGCLPIAGDLESLREWIKPGENGLLVDPGDPLSLAKAVLLAFDQPELRHSAQRQNIRLVTERAEYQKVMTAAESFYNELIESKKN